MPCLVKQQGKMVMKTPAEAQHDARRRMIEHIHINWDTDQSYWFKDRAAHSKQLRRNAADKLKSDQ